jgi:hypothetical protein
MVESAAHLVDHVFPEAPVRQWVLTFPFPLRFLFANDPNALSAVLNVVHRAIATFVVRHSGFTVSSGARTGAVTLIQRFGSALNLNVHLHMLFLDGAYRLSNNRLTFHRTRRPTCENLDSLLVTLSRRIVRALERRGLLIADPEHCCLDLEPGSSLDHLQAASINYRIAIGPHAGRKALSLYSVPQLRETSNNPLLARASGFSLHAATICEAWQRSRLECLCRYITRPPIATKRLSVDGRGRVVYRYKHPFRDGSTHVVLEPLELMAHLPVRHPSGDLRSSKSAILPICHRPPGRTGSHRTATSAARGGRRQARGAHELDAAAQAGLRYRHRDLPRAQAKTAWRFAHSARSLADVPAARAAAGLESLPVRSTASLGHFSACGQTVPSFSPALKIRR